MAVVSTAKKPMSQTKRKALQFHLYTLPWVIGFLTFVLGPMIYSLIISLTDSKMGGKLGNFIGLGNYIKMFTDDKLFWQSLGNTLYYALVSVPLGLALAFILACLLNTKMKTVGLFRTIFYLPSVMAGVSTVLLWGWIFNPSFGLLNYWLSLVGIEGPNWLGDPRVAMWTIIIMSIYNVGGSMIIFLAGLQDVPEELYESADLDGANFLVKTFRITLPMVTPVLFFNLIQGIIAGFQIFNQPFILTKGTGQPNHALYTYVMHLYANGFTYFKVGYGSALAWVLFIIILVLSAIVVRSSSYWVYYSGGND